jgi:hypothetical protein
LPPPLVAAAAASSKLNVRAWRASHDAQPLFIEDLKASCVYFGICFSLLYYLGTAPRRQRCH